MKKNLSNLTPAQLVKYARAFAAATAYAERSICRFRIAAVSSRPNSFGLHGYVLIARDGSAFEVARSVGPWNPVWNKGDDIVVNRNINGLPSWAGCEIPRRLPDCPQHVLRELFPA